MQKFVFERESIAMATLGAYTEYDEYLRMLTEAMRYKLRLNAHKGYLGDKTPAELLSKLKGEIPELQDAADRGSKIEMILEAADIANFALGFVVAAMKPQSQTLPPAKRLSDRYKT